MSDTISGTPSSKETGTVKRVEIVAKRLDAARTRLLDLTMRNRLLNYKATKRRTVPVIIESPREVFTRIVLEEKTMTFRATRDFSEYDEIDAETPQRLTFEDEDAGESEAEKESDGQAEAGLDASGAGGGAVIKPDLAGDASKAAESASISKPLPSTDSVPDTFDIAHETHAPDHFLEVVDAATFIEGAPLVQLDGASGVDADTGGDAGLFRRFVEPMPLPAETLPEQPDEEARSETTSVAEQWKGFVSAGVWGSGDAALADGSSSTDKFLQTPFIPDEMERKLTLVMREARSVLEEQGYSVLHLALAFLEWYEEDKTDASRNESPHYAPLVLVPVELSRSRLGAAFSVRWTGDEVFLNISLAEKLKEYKVEFPEFAIAEDADHSFFDGFLGSIAERIKDKKKWRIHSNIFLDFFSFTKFVMYKDLDSSAWPEGMTPAAHPLLLSLFAPVGDASAVADTGFPKDEVDVRLTARDLHHVRDADPSQIAVIEDIKAGRSMVVQGPPGTGKSQTITNAIAELLAMDKSVLFVSEKMAALEVVKARLDEAGLGDFCLELHSNKTNKREVLKEIERVSKLPPPAPESLEREYDRHTALRDELNSYARALREPIGAARLSPWLLYSMRETAIEQICCTHAAVPADVASGSDTADAADMASVAETEFGMPQYVTITNPQDCTAEQISAAEAALGNVEAMLRTIGPPAEHPWLGCAPTLVTPTDEPEVARLLDACRDALQVLCTSLEAMTEAASVVKSGSVASEVGRGDAWNAADTAVMVSGALLTRAATPARARSAIDAAELIARAPRVNRALLADPRWDAFPDDAAMLIAEATKYAELKGRALARMRATALDADAQPLATKFRDASASFFRFLNPSYHRLKKTILALYTARERRSDADLLADVTLLADAVSTRKRIEARSALGKELFGGAWRGCESDARELKRLGDWLVAFRRHLTAGDFQAVIEDAIANASAISATAIATAAVGARAAYARFAAARDALFARVKPDSARVFGADCDETPFDSFTGKLLQWRNAVGKLPRWSQYVEIARAASAELAKPVVELAEAGRVAPDMLNETFKLSLAESLLRYAFAERKVLALFESEVQESKIKRFGDLERMLIDKSRRLLAYELARKRPHLSGGVIPGSEMGILVTQINRKRRHLPLRKLFALCGGLISRIKPCFMMSPLSIAQFIDPRTARFDVIIFDEASQVRPEDALGALLRGAQLVVMGDGMQLPPTNFFDRVLEDDGGEFSDEALDDTLSGTESILDVAKTSFPSKTLSWHYRSRHESLIAVSNSEFYDNKLLIYPSPITNPQELGLSLSCHPDTVYDRGRSRTNRDEARLVVEAAIEHYKRHPEKSLGVGTFSMSQQQAIFDELDRAIKNDPEIEPYFNHQRFEHFFVKNLETIQGDERDVIFISVGYGKDKDGKLTLNFGPLNLEGGERRLNVLITRARERCVVFSNFRADAIALDAARDARLRGVRALKTFLKFAETRRLETIASVSTEVESEFEECVRRFLSENGYSVNPQVGCAGFRVDLGIVDAESPGRYLAGVECDGWKYHSSPVARDRDRLRQQVLEQLGWTIVRVWSTDWYQSRRDCEKRLLDRLAAIKAGRASGAGKAPGLSSTVAGSSSPKEDQADIANAAGIEPSSADARNADTTNAYVSDLVTPYMKCTSFGVPKRRELLETDPRILADAVAAVVKVEYPVHYTEVMRRIRVHWGVARLGARIEEHLRRAMAYAVRAGTVAAKGDYLYVPEYFAADAASKPRVPVRRRDDDPKPDLAIISDDEIAAAVVIVIRAQYSIFPDALAKESAYLLGFKAVSEETAAHIKKVIDAEIAAGRLVSQPNGMVGLRE